MQLQAWTTSSVLYGPGHGAHSAHQTSESTCKILLSPCWETSLSTAAFSFTYRGICLINGPSCLYFLPSQYPLRPPALFNNIHTRFHARQDTQRQMWPAHCLVLCPTTFNGFACLDRSCKLGPVVTSTKLGNIFKSRLPV